jgi:hypothetical protein
MATASEIYEAEVRFHRSAGSGSDRASDNDAEDLVQTEAPGRRGEADGCSDNIEGKTALHGFPRKVSPLGFS